MGDTSREQLTGTRVLPPGYLAAVVPSEFGTKLILKASGESKPISVRSTSLFAISVLSRQESRLQSKMCGKRRWVLWSNSAASAGNAARCVGSEGVGSVGRVGKVNQLYRVAFLWQNDLQCNLSNKGCKSQSRSVFTR